MQRVVTDKTHKWLIFDPKTKQWRYLARGIRRSDIFILTRPDWKIIHEKTEKVFYCISTSKDATIHYRPLQEVLHELPDEVREIVDANYNVLF